MSRTTFRTAFVLILVLAVSFAFLAVAWPFLIPLLLGALLAGLCDPLYRWVTRLLRRTQVARGWDNASDSFCSDRWASERVRRSGRKAGVGSKQPGPAVGAGAFRGGERFQRARLAGTAFSGARALRSRTGPDRRQRGQLAKASGTYLVGGATQLTASTATFLLNLFVMLYAMFYFLRDGGVILEKILYYTPLSHGDEVRVLERLRSVTRATIKGTVVIGIIQGTLAGIGLWFAGLASAAFWGTVMAVLSIVPGIGAALVWVPAVIYLFVIGEKLTATLLLIWCAAVVGTIDNMLRPKLVGKDAKMPDLLILIGTLGGLFLFGPIGFIIGPLVCGLFLTVWEIYGATFKDVLPPVGELVTGQIKKADANLPASEESESKTP